MSTYSRYVNCVCLCWDYVAIGSFHLHCNKIVAVKYFAMFFVTRNDQKVIFSQILL